MSAGPPSPDSGFLQGEVMDGFRAGFRGSLFVPEEPGYDQARQLWNAMVDRRPALIARCSGPADVQAALRFGREAGLEIAVRSGGHNAAGRAMCDGGLVVDLSALKGIRVDPSNRTARAQAGVNWGEFDRETQAFGLATTGGAVTTTGIAGLTLGGGVGWLMGEYGMTCDNLRSVDVVLADGTFVTASEDEHPDLFWGMRGGGGNFGIATSFEYDLHPLGPVIGGMVLHPASEAREVLHFYREITSDAPDQLTVYAGFLTSPEGDPLTALILCWCGDLAEGERAIQPVRDFGEPVADLLQPMPYVVQQSLFDEVAGWGRHSYWKAGDLDELSDEAINEIVARCAAISSAFSVCLIEHHHGAMTRVTADATAFPHRDAPYEVVAMSLWTDPAESERHVSWTRDFFEAMRPFYRSGVYINTLDHDETDRVREAYGQNFDRLVEVKDRYDPNNVFHLNHNVVPSAGVA